MLNSLAYDPESGTVQAEFPNGSASQYFGVPKSTLDSVLNAESVGSAFHHQIKTKFVGQKVR
jgi:non-canonical (house-cleaning) NTP pyrophosphatase